jgi:hypothetical protein
VSTHVQCPACGRAAANIVSPRKEWGTLYDGLELERACDQVDSSGEEGYTFDSSDGRDTFECPCGQAIWIEHRRDAHRAHAFQAHDGDCGNWFSRVKAEK